MKKERLMVSLGIPGSSVIISSDSENFLGGATKWQKVPLRKE